jgi:hypothetical protein
VEVTSAMLASSVLAPLAKKVQLLTVAHIIAGDSTYTQSDVGGFSHSFVWQHLEFPHHRGDTTVLSLLPDSLAADVLQCRDSTLSPNSSVLHKELDSGSFPRIQNSRRRGTRGA